jgi:hypothetical protein
MQVQLAEEDETEVVVDEEFKSLIPKHTPEEYEMLEASLLEEGCREKVVVWAENNTILDGHTRAEICDRLHIDYAVTKVSFTDRSEAIQWMIRNQLGRRNLSDIDRVELANRLKPLLLEKNRENKKVGRGNVIDHPASTRKNIARIAHVGETTVAKVDKIKSQGAPELIDAARSSVTVRERRSDRFSP